MIEYPVKIGDQEFQLKVTHTIGELREAWDHTARNSIYFESDYLKLLEEYGILNYSYCYVLVSSAEVNIAIYYFQHKTISLYEDFRVHTHSANPLRKFIVWLQRQSFRMVNQELLVSGNVLLTGEYAFYYNEHVSDSIKVHLAESIFKKTADYIRNKTGKRIQSILSKDFYATSHFAVDKFHGKNFTRFKVEPDMVVTMDPAWRSYEDYLAAVRSKYRVKFKKVMKKGKNLQFEDLTLDRLIEVGPDIYNLYLHTADKAAFSLFTLHPEYFIELKRVYPDRFHATGVFLEGQLVAFFTLIVNNSNADAHFLGYDPALNVQHQIYFNILLKLIAKAIESQAQYLNLSRTALEIKSSVGAEPYPMDIYLRHKNDIINGLLPRILDMVVPEKDWVQRSPFKD